MYELIARYVYGSIWAIDPAKLAVILGVLRLRMAGERLSLEEIRARVGNGREIPDPYLVPAAAAGRPGEQPAGGIQVIPLYGTISQRAGLMSESSGGTSTERVSKQLRAALGDPGVAAIVLDVDSPGGTVYGVPELADEIYRARGQKPIVAVANSQAASAAYHIATAADELLVAPSGEVGSIGVYAMHEDHSKELEQDGVAVSLISAGKYKTEGNPFGPLSEEARAHEQERVDAYYDTFVKAVARGRGVSASLVRSDFGEGRMVMAAQAVKLGMVDAVGTLDDAVGRAAKLARQQSRSSRADDLTLRLRMRGV